MQELVHGSEYACIIRRCGKNQLGVTESILYVLGKVRSAKVTYLNFGGALGSQDIGQLLGCLQSSAVD